MPPEMLQHSLQPGKKLRFRNLLPGSTEHVRPHTPDLSRYGQYVMPLFYFSHKFTETYCLITFLSYHTAFVPIFRPEWWESLGVPERSVGGWQLFPFTSQKSGHVQGYGFVDGQTGRPMFFVFVCKVALFFRMQSMSQQSVNMAHRDEKHRLPFHPPAPNDHRGAAQLRVSRDSPRWPRTAGHHRGRAGSGGKASIVSTHAVANSEAFCLWEFWDRLLGRHSHRPCPSVGLQELPREVAQ